MKLHLFNPENDLALALGCRHYTPPPHAAALHRAGALLPAWWASPGDAVLVPPPGRASYEADAQWLASQWGVQAPLHRHGEPWPGQGCPWGWSADSRRQLAAAGVPGASLPSSGAIEAMRQLSHRRTSIALLGEMGLGHLAARELASQAQVEALEAGGDGRGHFYKSPWSCSGRGVFSSAGLERQVTVHKCAGIIHRQGSVMAERLLGRVLEVGALFQAHTGGRIEPLGLSMTLSEGRGAYTGNIAAPQSWLWQRLEALGMDRQVQQAVDSLATALASILRDAYVGPLGIDMMVFRSPGGDLGLHPCIELNLRRTMGNAAMHVASRLGLQQPRLISWQRGNPDIAHPADGHAPGTLPPLLPPRDGFCLTLTPLQNDSITDKPLP